MKSETLTLWDTSAFIRGFKFKTALSFYGEKNVRGFPSLDVIQYFHGDFQPYQNRSNSLMVFLL